MNKKMVSYLCTLLIMILLTSCNVGNDKLKYLPPTKEQVNDFISENSINALSIKEASEFTVILFESDAADGHYVLYKDQNNKLYSASVKGMVNPTENPISLGGVATGKTPFVTVIINDKDLLLKAKEIEITFSDGTIEKEAVLGKGTIVLHNNKNDEKAVSYTKVVIYDKDMTKLYEK